MYKSVMNLHAFSIALVGLGGYWRLSLQSKTCQLTLFKCQEYLAICQLIVDTKRTFRTQNKKKIKTGMLPVLKVYLKIYNHFENWEGL